MSNLPYLYDLEPKQLRTAMHFSVNGDIGDKLAVFVKINLEIDMEIFYNLEIVSQIKDTVISKCRLTICCSGGGWGEGER